MKFLYELRTDPNMSNQLAQTIFEEELATSKVVKSFNQVNKITVYAVRDNDYGSSLETELYTDKTIVKYAEHNRKSAYEDEPHYFAHKFPVYTNPIKTPVKAVSYLEDYLDMTVEIFELEV